MNEALWWVSKSSKATGAPRRLLAAIAKCAQGCIAQVTRRELLRKTGPEHSNESTFYWSVSSLEKLGELERILHQQDKQKVRVFHLKGYCDSRNTPNFHNTLECLKSASAAASARYEHSSGPKTMSIGVFCGNPKTRSEPKLPGAQPFLFPRVLTETEAREICEECRGAGWKEVEYPNTHGEMVRGAAICTHARARIAGRWNLTESPMRDAFLQAQLAQTLAKPKLAPPRFKLES